MGASAVMMDHYLFLGSIACTQTSFSVFSGRADSQIVHLSVGNEGVLVLNPEGRRKSLEKFEDNVLFHTFIRIRAAAVLDELKLPKEFPNEDDGYKLSHAAS